MLGPLFRLEQVLPSHVRAVADRATPIPTLAQAAKQQRAEHTEMVRADIGQVVGVKPKDEILYGPPVGLTPLRQALAELNNRSFSLPGAWPDKPAGLAAANVVVCTGAAEALSLCFECFGSDRTVGVPRGHWSNYDNAIALSRGQLRQIDFFDDRGRFSAAALQKQLQAQKLHALVANFPCNPTGAVLDAEETAKLAAVIRDTDIVLIADEVYARLRYDGVPPQSLLRDAPGHTVSIGSASKEYLMPGGRVGYLLSANADLTDRVMRKLVRARTASPNVMAQQKLLQHLHGDLAAMRDGHPPLLIERIRSTMQRRRDSLVEQLRSVDMPPLGRRPDGTIFLIASLPPWWKHDDNAFCEQAIALGLFSAIPGSAFGLTGAVRFSFGAMTDDDIRRLPSRIALFRKTTAAA